MFSVGLLIRGITVVVAGEIGWIGQIVLDLVVVAKDTGLERCGFERTNVLLTSITVLLVIRVPNIVTVTRSVTMEEFLPVIALA